MKVVMRKRNRRREASMRHKNKYDGDNMGGCGRGKIGEEANNVRNGTQ